MIFVSIPNSARLLKQPFLFRHYFRYHDLTMNFCEPCVANADITCRKMCVLQETGKRVRTIHIIQYHSTEKKLLMTNNSILTLLYKG